ncbi:hypothetical protein [Thalassotalea sp. G2M2-11]|uniref:SPOR domain-containing protein n=1 Tax=Thalassotalea sp. G2M2-11 TaxID=2787627 RepID=UPI0019D08532|nr:hypothetical protein [Thalassotalea sp. G2M2-11]
MSALAQNINNQVSSESVTAISATARVDYILRFSKQAVLVVDDDISISSDVGRQFLSNLTSEQNAAYVTMSSKLNDVQVRCRLIEQLFGNILFDPEQSIAVSIINIVKQQQQPVTIVIDNGDYLSLQILHELTQLAEIAKKANYQISVLLLATRKLAQLVYQNQVLFEKKLTILSAENGQLVPLNAKEFKVDSSLFSITPFKKWFAFFTVLSVLSAAVIYYLYQQDSLSFSQLNSVPIEAIDTNSASLAKATAPKFVSEVLETNIEHFASSKDVLLALTALGTEQNTKEKAPVKAQPIDILGALQLDTAVELPVNTGESQRDTVSEKTHTTNTPTAQHTDELKVTPILQLSKNEAVSQALADKITKPQVIKASKFLDRTQGFVIQIAAFSQQQVLAEFIAEYPSLSFEQYQKNVNGSVMTIVTTGIFDTQAVAEQVIVTLPNTIKQRSPMIKDISVINQEINEFKLSQSKGNNVTIAN